MIQRNNNLSVLPFYTNVDEQNHRKPYAYGEVYPLYTPLGSVPPFQIVIPISSATISSVLLHKVNDFANGTDVTDRMTGLSKVRFSGAMDYEIILYPSIAPNNITTEEGQYQLSITMSDDTTYISDVFTAIADVSGMIQVQWYDLTDLIMDGCRITYRSGFKNVLWLPTLLGKPEYEFNEEGEERDGYFFPEKMISEKKYKCTFLAPEYLCDVMRFIRMSDIVIVKDNYNNEYRCDTFLITPKWQEQGDLASVELEFTCDTVAKKVGRGYIYGDNGDFNDDFNNDFDINDNN